MYRNLSRLRPRGCDGIKDAIWKDYGTKALSQTRLGHHLQQPENSYKRIENNGQQFEMERDKQKNNTVYLDFAEKRRHFAGKQRL